MNPLRSSGYGLSLQLIKNNANINCQSIRHNLRYKRKEPMRKPVWQPIAPSKLYRIKKKEVLTAEEQAQRNIWQNDFDKNMNFVKSYLRKEFYLPTLEDGGRSHDEVINEEEEQKRLIEENDQDNKMVAEVRANRLKEFEANKISKLMARQLEIEEENRLRGLELDELVRQEIENSKTFITKENLDERIELALKTQATYLD